MNVAFNRNTIRNSSWCDIISLWSQFIVTLITKLFCSDKFPICSKYVITTCECNAIAQNTFCVIVDSSYVNDVITATRGWKFFFNQGQEFEVKLRKFKNHISLESAEFLTDKNWSKPKHWTIKRLIRFSNKLWWSKSKAYLQSWLIPKTF